MAYERIYLAHLTARLAEKRRFVQVLAGPRQVGKTTIVRQFLAKTTSPTHYAAADAVTNADKSWLEQQWQTARLKWQQSGAAEFVLVIDEVQKAPNWSETVKRLWDEDTMHERPIKAVLLGSSRLLLQQGLTESLAGRFELTHIGHWSLAEMRDAFGWGAERFVWFGGYPGAAELAEDEPRWKRYVDDSLIETSISRDILMMTRVDKPALMRRLFELGCQYSGQVLSFTKILGQLQDAGNTTTLAHYLNLLDQAGLLAGLDKFAGDQARQRGSSPKFQVHNTALFSAQRGESFEQVRTDPESWGRWVESVIGAHLINGSFAGDYKVCYWRQGDIEVDFVLEKKGRAIGIEVKSGKAGKTPGMAAFQRAFSPEKVLLISENSLSWREFLLLNPNDLF